MTNQCAGCGKAQDQWSANKGQGFKASTGKVYCCQGCAEGKTCTCQQAKVA